MKAFRIGRAGARVLLPVLLLAALAGGGRPALAVDSPVELVERATITARTLINDPKLTELPNYLARARGVLIIPSLIKGGLIIGAEGGSGVLLVKGSDGSWSSPAFYTLAAGSIGLQIGGQVSEVVFTLMSEGAIEAVLKNKFKLGADASIAVGPIGAGVEASTTTNLNADVYAFSRAVGLFGGGALEGAAIVPNKDWNREYYGTDAVDPRAIVIDRKFYNGHADPLRTALMPKAAN